MEKAKDILDSLSIDDIEAMIAYMNNPATMNKPRFATISYNAKNGDHHKFGVSIINEIKPLDDMEEKENRKGDKYMKVVVGNFDACKTQADKDRLKTDLLNRKAEIQTIIDKC